MRLGTTGEGHVGLDLEDLAVVDNFAFAAAAFLVDGQGPTPTLFLVAIPLFLVVPRGFPSFFFLLVGERRGCSTGGSICKIIIVDFVTFLFLAATTPLTATCAVIGSGVTSSTCHDKVGCNVDNKWSIGEELKRF